MGGPCALAVLQRGTNYKRGGVGDHRALAVLQGGTNYKRGGVGDPCALAVLQRGTNYITGVVVGPCALRRHKTMRGRGSLCPCCAASRHHV